MIHVSLFISCRSQKWIKMLGRPELLNKTHEKLRTNYRVCADHFEDDQFMFAGTKNSLIHTAIPTIFNAPESTCKITRTRIKRALPKNVEEKPRTCYTCLKMFDSEELLRSHCCVHPEDSSDINVAMKEEGTTNFLTHRKKKPHVCEKCYAVFTEEEHLIIHKQTHKGEFHFICGECKAVFTLQVDLEKHIETQHQHPRSGGSLGCVIKEEPNDDASEKSYVDLPVMTIPKSEIQSDDNNTEEPEGSQGSEEFTVKSTEADNVRKVIVVKRHQCAQCNKTFAQKGTLTRHLRTHSNEKKFQCDQCDKTFTLKGNLIRHLKRHTKGKSFNKSVNRFECTQCKKVFCTEDRFRKHLATTKHSTNETTANFMDGLTATTVKRSETQSDDSDVDIEGLEESENNEEFISKSVEGSNSGKDGGLVAKRHQCDQCDKAFPRKVDLTRHLRTHSGDKPFQCPQCDKAFTVKGSLTRHLRTHSGDKPFQCPQCDKAFTVKVNLARHLKGPLHLKEPSQIYHCDPCGEKFSLNSDLTKHLRTHTVLEPLPIRKGTHKGGSRFVCSECKAVFTLKADLEKHIQKYHQNSQTFVQDGRPEGSKEPEKPMEPGEPMETGEPGELVEPVEPEKCKVQCESMNQLRRCPNKKHVLSTSSEKAFTSEADVARNCGERLYQCALCDKTFEETSSLRRHGRMLHSDVMPFQCDQCDEGFIAKSTLIDHARTCHNEKSFHLNDMSKVELNETVENASTSVIIQSKQINECSDMTQISDNQNVNRFECTQCKMLFRTEDRLHKHLATATHKSEQRYQCDVCGKSFKMENHLKEHEKIHLEKTLDFKFNIKEEAKDQFSSIGEPVIKSETQDDNYATEELGEHGYPKEPRELEEPKKLEKPEEPQLPFQCDKCNKGFEAKSALTEHMKTDHFSVFAVTRRSQGKVTSVDILHHTVAKNLITVSSALKRHLESQRIEKPHLCSQCDKAFADRINLAKHLRTHKLSV